MSDIVERLDSLSVWLLQNDIDMKMPEGMVDPAEAAAEITALRERVKVLEAERDGIRAAIAAEAAIVCEKLAHGLSDDGQITAELTARTCHDRILALAKSAPGMVCVPVEREFICKSCHLRISEGKPQGESPF